MLFLDLCFSSKKIQKWTLLISTWLIMILNTGYFNISLVLKMSYACHYSNITQRVFHCHKPLNYPFLVPM